MRLSDYLIQADGKIARDGTELVRLAEVCETTPYYLFMVAGGYKRAGFKLANALEAATDGKVRRIDTRPDIFGPPEAA